jgi:multiple sugar transport system substrate-binding protein
MQYIRAKQEIRKLVDTLREINQPMLPVETELTRQLGVGRNTVRKAIGELVQEGVLERFQGKGTFIVDDQKEISFADWVSAELPSGFFLNKVIEEFTRKEPSGYRIKEIIIPYHIYLQKIFHLIMNGTAPDVVQLTPIWLRRFQRYNVFLSLSAYISQNIIKRRYTTAFNLGRIRDEIYSLNWVLCPLVLYYNKTVLDRAGLDPEKPPETMDELAEMSMRVNERKIDNLYGFCVPTDMREFSFMSIYPILLAFKGGFSDPIGSIMVDCNENIRALSWLAKFYQKGGVTKENNINGIRMLFASDHLAFMFDGPYGRGNLRQLSSTGKEFDSHYGIAQIPVGVSGKSESVLLAHSLSIPRQCRSPDRSYRWIEFLATDEKTAMFYFQEFGMIPCNRDVLHKPFFLSDPFASVMIRQAESASAGPIDHPLFLDTLPFFLQIIAQIILHNRDPGTGLSLMREIINMIGQANGLRLP